MTIKAMIFDLDGTLLNTLDDLCTSTNYALSSHNLPIRTKEEIRSFVGNGVRLLIERAVPSNTLTTVVDSVFTTFREHYQLHMNDQTRPYDRIIELLEELHTRNIKTAIVSNKYDVAVKQLANEHFHDLIDVAIGESIHIPKKPSPDGILFAINQLGGTIHDCIYIGDSDIDMITAKNANVTGVGVTWGFRSEDCLLENGAAHIIHHPEELLNLL